MGTLTKQYTFVANTDIVSNEVNVNFDDIVSFINTQLVHADGTKPFTAVPVGPAVDPTTANQLTRKAYVDAGVAGANAAASAASASAASAQTAASAAQGSANNALSVANSKMAADAVRAGVMTGTTNGAGDIVINHGLGRTPAGFSVTPINGGTSKSWDLAVENYDASTLNVRMFNNNGGGVLAGAGVTLSWIVVG